jgi:hypothetical protein
VDAANDHSLFVTIIAASLLVWIVPSVPDQKQDDKDRDAYEPTQPLLRDV